MADDKQLKYLADRIKSKLPELANRIYKDYRKELDLKTTILDISYNALIVNVYRGKNLSSKEIELYSKIYDTLVEVVREASKGKTFSSLDDPGFLKLFNAPKSPGAILIDNGKNDIFLVGKSFEAIRNFTTNYISKNPKLKSTRFGEKTIFDPILDSKGRETGDYKKRFRSKVDIGHIPQEGIDQLSSPLETKISSVLEYGLQAGNTRISNVAQNALKKLYEIQLNVGYNFKNTAPEAIEKAQRVLGKGYLVVTLHTQEKNNRFSQIEKQIYDKLISEIALSLSPHTAKGSNSIIEDISAVVASIFNRGKTKVQSHRVQAGTNSTKIKSKVSAQGSTIKLPTIKPTEDRDKVSNVNLLAILQAAINKKVAENMGSGSEHRILNYRTGRLAESVSIPKISESRQGMISVFYSYMKNPYATFSEGGRQQYPKTRDPKLLISQSIRDIATPIVGNRLRSVVV